MKLLPVLAALAFAFAGCGSGDDDAGPDTSASTTSPSLGAPIPGGGLSIAEATASNLDGPLLVRGYLIERDGELRLCDAILESSPPQCGEPSLRVKGPAPGPSEQRVSLLGEVENETITVSETATG